MTRRIRLLAAGLTVAAAAVAAPTLTNASTPPDTTWGAPDTTADTTWGNPPVGNDGDGGETTPVRPADTTWG
ncbi:hypothetical protein [Streptomyces sp. PU_AKi4]|uniref:hypothetical protein n=1 Tax=Streptomyces sp. PU_AKi4 TaxID=2800809 RepID=UPI0035260CF5